MSALLALLVELWMSALLLWQESHCLYAESAGIYLAVCRFCLKSGELIFPKSIEAVVGRNRYFHTGFPEYLLVAPSM